MADAHAKHHDYHLVDPSPWPIVGSLSAFILAIGLIAFLLTASALASLNIVGAGSRGLKRVNDHVGDHADRVLEHLAAFHPEVANGLSRGRTAVDIQFRLVTAVGPQMCGQNPAVRTGAGLRHGVEHDRARPVAEQHAGGAIVPIKQPRKSLRPDDERPLEAAGLEEAIGGSKRIATPSVETGCRRGRYRFPIQITIAIPSVTSIPSINYRTRARIAITFKRGWNIVITWQRRSWPIDIRKIATIGRTGSRRSVSF